MSYAGHEMLACKWGVELVGWTESKIENPASITTSIALNRLLLALRNGDCHWSVMTQEVWDARVEALQLQVTMGKGKARAVWKDAGVSRKRKHGSEYTSAEMVNDSNEDDEVGLED